jgi:hypothetical protein
MHGNVTSLPYLQNTHNPGITDPEGHDVIPVAKAE